ncbi:unnamed protein product, partial [marine sediment metagenome]
LDYYIHHCLAPCIGVASKEEYAEVIKQVILFLEGKQEVVVQELESKMNKAAEALNFEQAAWLRDQIQAINRVIEGQRIATAVRGEQDVIALARLAVGTDFTPDSPIADKAALSCPLPPSTRIRSGRIAQLFVAEASLLRLNRRLSTSWSIA